MYATACLDDRVSTISDNGNSIIKNYRLYTLVFQCDSVIRLKLIVRSPGEAMKSIQTFYDVKGILATAFYPNCGGQINQPGSLHKA